MENQILSEHQILNLKQENHLCLIYDKDPLEQMPALIPFIKQGLENNEQFIYIADDISVLSLSDCIKSLGDELLRCYNLNPERVEIDVDIKDAVLDVDTGITCGLILKQIDDKPD